MNAGCIEEHDLSVRIIAYAENPVPRRLRLVGHNRQLGADQPVQQSGLPRVGTADEGDEAGFHHTVRDFSSASSFSIAGGNRLQILTRLMRRRSTSSTSTVRPSISNFSATAGTRPMCDRRYPPTVSNPPRSISTARRWASSSMLARPLTTKRPLPSSTIGGYSPSFPPQPPPPFPPSSSSIATSPGAPPYSSTTIPL